MLFSCIFMHSCVFCVIFFYEFYLKISTSSQAEFSFNTYFPQICIRKNHRLLRMLNVSNIHLDKICKLAQKHGLSGKYTDLGRYAYIWCTNKIDIAIFINKLKKHDFDVIQTNMHCTGVRIEEMWRIKVTSSSNTVTKH